MILAALAMSVALTTTPYSPPTIELIIGSSEERRYEQGEPIEVLSALRLDLRRKQLGALTLRLTDASGKSTAAKFERLDTTGKRDAWGREEVRWLLPAKEAKKLPLGRYTLVLEHRSGGSVEQSRPRVLHIDGPQKRRKENLRIAAEDALALRRYDRAWQLNEAHLTTSPEDVDALVLRARILDARGEFAAALKALRHARDVEEERNPTSELLRVLLLVERKIEGKLRAEESAR